ncbi:hypothetical protein VNO77_36151 [Canavalia gladiata]|uniref:BZIP domain-containing protein n=1 Tax=Canavalia gladiata TaxID=3824 RepID=A0AAN9K9S2_CANGL
MESKDKKDAKPYRNSVPQDAYHNFGSAPTSSLNPTGSYFKPSWLAHKTWNKQPQFDSVYDSRRLSNYPMAAGVGQGALFAYADQIQRTFAGKNMNSMNTLNESLQPISKVTEESRENGKRFSLPKTNLGGLTRSVATPVVGHGVDNVRGSTNFSFKNSYNLLSFQLQDFPSTKQQQSSLISGNGRVAQNATSTVHEKRNIAFDHFEANPTELNRNLDTGLNASDSNPQLEKQEDEETKKRRKRLANREACKRFRLRKQMECEELSKSVEYLSVKNGVLKKKLRDLSEECVELAKENNSLLEELIQEYGQETVANIMNTEHS